MNDSQKARELRHVVDTKYERYARVIAEQLDHKVFKERANEAGMLNTYWEELKTRLTEKPSDSCGVLDDFVERCCSKFLKELPPDERRLLWLGTNAADKAEPSAFWGSTHWNELTRELCEWVKDLALEEAEKEASCSARQVADHACRQITKRTISGLQRIPATLSGDDSELQNPWDEICVQVQSEESFFWHVYEETMTGFLAAEVERLEQFERDAIWLRTEAGANWDWDDNPLKSPEPPTYDPDITDYILHKYLLPAAENWSNRRIRTYLDRYDNLNAVLRKDAEAGKIRLSRGI